MCQLIITFYMPSTMESNRPIRESACTVGALSLAHSILLYMWRSLIGCWQTHGICGLTADFSPWQMTRHSTHSTHSIGIVSQLPTPITHTNVTSLILLLSPAPSHSSPLEMISPESNTAQIRHNSTTVCTLS